MLDEIKKDVDNFYEKEQERINEKLPKQVTLIKMFKIVESRN